MPKFVLVSIIVIMLAAIPLYFFTKKKQDTPPIDKKEAVAEKSVKKTKTSKAIEVEKENHLITPENVTPVKGFSDITGTWQELIMSGYTPEIGFEFNVNSNDPNLGLATNVLTLKNNTYNKTYNNKMCDTPGILTAALKFNSAGQFALNDPQFEGCENFYFTPNEVKIKNATFFKYDKNYLVLVMNEANTAVVFKRKK